MQFEFCATRVVDRDPPVSSTPSAPFVPRLRRTLSDAWGPGVCSVVLRRYIFPVVSSPQF